MKNTRDDNSLWSYPVFLPTRVKSLLCLDFLKYKRALKKGFFPGSLKKLPIPNTCGDNSADMLHTRSSVSHTAAFK